MPTSKTASQFITVEEAAELMGVSGQTVRDWIRQKRLRGRKGLGRTSPWQVEKKSVEELIATLTYEETKSHAFPA